MHSLCGSVCEQTSDNAAAHLLRVLTLVQALIKVLLHLLRHTTIDSLQTVTQAHYITAQLGICKQSFTN